MNALKRITPIKVVATLAALVYLVLMGHSVFGGSVPVVVSLLEIPIAVAFGFIFGEAIHIYRESR